jgi:5,6-dimethylbenzimidazole synthase
MPGFKEWGIPFRLRSFISKGEEMTDHRFPEEWRQGVYEAIARRRDMRSFKSQPLEKEVLARILKAAHQAGSVGYCQPWNFIVIEDKGLRSKIHDHVTQERLKAAENFVGERREKYLAYKLEGILDSAVNVCVTCDRTRFGPTVIGRNTMKDTDIYSTCGAVQNLWLAARAEGVGVGWVSILEPEKLRSFLGFPHHVEPVAYLCLGYVEEFPEKPLFQTSGWLPRIPLSEAVYYEEWGRVPPKEMTDFLRQTEVD